MDPHSRQKTDQIGDDMFDVGDENVLGGYSEEELVAMLAESEESGICEQSLDEIFEDLFLKHFGRKPTREERSADLARGERFFKGN